MTTRPTTSLIEKGEIKPWSIMLAETPAQATHAIEEATFRSRLPSLPDTCSCDARWNHVLQNYQPLEGSYRDGQGNEFRRGEGDTWWVISETEGIDYLGNGTLLKLGRELLLFDSQSNLHFIGSKHNERPQVFATARLTVGKDGDQASMRVTWERIGEAQIYPLASSLGALVQVVTGSSFSFIPPDAVSTNGELTLYNGSRTLRISTTKDRPDRFYAVDQRSQSGHYTQNSSLVRDPQEVFGLHLFAGDQLTVSQDDQEMVVVHDREAASSSVQSRFSHYSRSNGKTTLVAHGYESSPDYLSSGRIALTYSEVSWDEGYITPFLKVPFRWQPAPGDTLVFDTEARIISARRASDDSVHIYSAEGALLFRSDLHDQRVLKEVMGGLTGETIEGLPHFVKDQKRSYGAMYPPDYAEKYYPHTRYSVLAYLVELLKRNDAIQERAKKHANYIRDDEVEFSNTLAVGKRSFCYVVSHRMEIC